MNKDKTIVGKNKGKKPKSLPKHTDFLYDVNCEEKFVGVLWQTAGEREEQEGLMGKESRQTCGRSISAQGVWNMIQRLGERISEGEWHTVKQMATD